ncbi:uncharacterized protein LOC135216663 [Macrobrachium nipponense]|uniref:uncharacterized protein LOC135216663 n=1 Tax=Macrobrachium nipponense TaxID=159736 RepID=UPI0030C883DF
MLGITALSLAAPSYPRSVSASAPEPDYQKKTRPSPKSILSADPEEPKEEEEPTAKGRPKARTIRFNSNSVVTTPANPFLSSISGSGRNSDRSDEVLSTKDTIKILTGIMPALTKALIDSDSTGAEKMRDITLAFLPLARDVVESRGSDFGRSVNNEEVTAVEYAEQVVPSFMDAMVDYVDELATGAPFQFDVDEVLDNIPEVKLPKFDGPLIPDVEIPDIVIPEVEIPNFNVRG